MRNRTIPDRITQIMTDRETDREMKIHKTTILMQIEETDIVEERIEAEHQEINLDIAEISPEMHLEADTEAEDSLKEAVAQKTEEDTMMRIEIGNLTMARAGTERVARSPWIMGGLL